MLKNDSIIKISFMMSRTFSVHLQLTFILLNKNKMSGKKSDQTGNEVDENKNFHLSPLALAIIDGWLLQSILEESAQSKKMGSNE